MKRVLQALPAFSSGLEGRLLLLFFCCSVRSCSGSTLKFSHFCDNISKMVVGIDSNPLAGVAFEFPVATSKNLAIPPAKLSTKVMPRVYDFLRKVPHLLAIWRHANRVATRYKIFLINGVSNLSICMFTWYTFVGVGAANTIVAKINGK